MDGKTTHWLPEVRLLGYKPDKWLLILLGMSKRVLMQRSPWPQGSQRSGLHVELRKSNGIGLKARDPIGMRGTNKSAGILWHRS